MGFDNNNLLGLQIKQLAITFVIEGDPRNLLGKEDYHDVDIGSPKGFGIGDTFQVSGKVSMGTENDMQTMVRFVQGSRVRGEEQEEVRSISERIDFTERS